MDRRETANNVNDGFYQISYENDGVYLSVYPPVGNGRRVDLQTVLDRLGRKRIRNFNRDIVQLAVTKAEKTPVKIASPQDEIRVDVTANVTTSPDKMKGYISFNPPENGRMMSMDEVLDQLSKNGIIYGINRTNLETIVKYPVYNEMICIAEGTPSINGQNGKVEFHFDIKRESKPTILEDGRVDFRELNLIQSAEQGQTLCTLKPPIRGTPGKTVCGIDIPALDVKPAS